MIRRIIPRALKSLLWALGAGLAWAQASLPVKWEELTFVDFATAIQKSQGTCVLPLGILESHGPHLPIGTDLFNVRHAVFLATQQEYAIVFPEFYVGQIFEARYQPGAIAYSVPLQLQLLRETTDEMARNGCKKIFIVNGHGGNNLLAHYFAQTQLSEARDYVIYEQNVATSRIYETPGRPATNEKTVHHAGFTETSWTMASRPDLVRQERVGTLSGEQLNRLNLPPGVYTAIEAYARFPNHYEGDAAGANKKLGEFDLNVFADSIVTALRAIKADQVSLKLQTEFNEKVRQVGTGR